MFKDKRFAFLKIVKRETPDMLPTYILTNCYYYLNQARIPKKERRTHEVLCNEYFLLFQIVAHIFTTRVRPRLRLGPAPVGATP